MRSVVKGLPLLLAVSALASSNAVAQDKPAEPKVDKESIETRLEAAQKRLEAAAAEVGELSAQLGETVAHNFMFYNNDPRRAVLGVQLDSGSGNDGARVKEVSPGGPSAEAGVRSGDVIVGINGKEVKSSRELVKHMRDIEPESKVKLKVMRDGKARELEVTPRRIVRRFAWGTPPTPPEPMEPMEPMEPFNFNFDFMNHWRGGLSGMELATLTPGLGSYFGADKGVLVLRAPADESYKLKDGDVILTIDGREPTSGTHATRILRSYQPGEKLTLRIMRDRKAQNIEIALPEPQRRERAPRGERDA